jgi:hypothetical protein
MRHPYSKAGKRAYQQNYRHNAAKHLCDCGQPAVVYRACAFMCARCALDQNQERFHDLHKPTCGVRGHSANVFSLCLPNGVTL